MLQSQLMYGFTQGRVFWNILSFGWSADCLLSD